MGLRTLIQWTDSTGNLEIGCDGCELWIPEKGIKICYAGKLTELHAGQPGWPESFDKPTLFPERLQQILRWSDLRGTVRSDKPWIPPELPRLIFLDDVGDTFSESLPLDWLAEHLPAMAASAHIYIVLTKRPASMRDFLRRPPVPRTFWPL